MGGAARTLRRTGRALLLSLLLFPGGLRADPLATPLSVLLDPVIDEILPMTRCAGLLLAEMDPEISDGGTAERFLAIDRFIRTGERFSRETRAGRPPGATVAEARTFAAAYRARSEGGRPWPLGDRDLCYELARLTP